MKHLLLLLSTLLWACLAPLAHADAEPLPAEQAYRVEASLLDDHTIEVRFAIEPGYYLYRNKLDFLLDPDASLLGTPALPKGLDHEDRYFGHQQIYRDALRFTIPLKSALAKPATLIVTHQGCADMGVCYPPTTVTLPLQLANMSRTGVEGGKPQSALLGGLDGGAANTAQATTTTAANTAAPSSIVQSAPVAPEGDHSQSLLAKAGTAWMMLGFFGFGLLLCFTPCTLPMLPILSGIIVGHGHRISHTRAAVLSAAYVLGMAVTYAVAGVIAGYAGQLLSAWLQNAWVLGAFALLFVFLALSMFGVYTLQLPSRWQTMLTGPAASQGGSIPHLLLVGALSALIVGPCVTAPLAGALAYIAHTHNALRGGLALFALGLGMGAPLILVSITAHRLLPKPGPWMEAINRLFGLLLLGLALYIVSPVLPPAIPMFGWAVLLVFGGVMFHALDGLPAGAHTAERALKALGLLLLLAGAVILVGAFAGSRNPLRPLEAFQAQTKAPRGPRFTAIHSNAELDAQIAASQRPVVLDFYADWCVSCREMEDQTFPAPEVAARLAGFTLLRVDVTANTPEDRALLQRFGLYAPPGILFFAPEGKEIEGRRVIGFMAADSFGERLAQINP
jgi:thioredoxin:protein disulfide reductase